MPNPERIPWDRDRPGPTPRPYHSYLPPDTAGDAGREVFRIAPTDVELLQHLFNFRSGPPREAGVGAFPGVGMMTRTKGFSGHDRKGVDPMEAARAFVKALELPVPRPEAGPDPSPFGERLKWDGVLPHAEAIKHIPIADLWKSNPFLAAEEEDQRPRRAAAAKAAAQAREEAIRKAPLEQLWQQDPIRAAQEKERREAEDRRKAPPPKPQRRLIDPNQPPNAIIWF